MDPQHILESISDGFFALDSTGCIIYANAATQTEFGLTQSQLLGQVFWDLFPHAHTSVLHREASLVTQSKQRSHLVTQFPTPDRTLEMYLYPDNQGGLSVYFRAIGDRLESTDEIRQRDTFYRLLVENAMEYAIFGLDLLGNITHWNEGAQRLLGYDEDEVRGRHATLIYTPEDNRVSAFQGEMQRARETGRAKNERWHVRKDGSRFWGSGFLIGLRDAGHLHGFVKIMRDNTEREEIEATLRQYKDIFHFSQQGIAIGNPSTQNLDQTNAAFARMHGCQPGEMTGMRILDLFPERERELALRTWQEVDSTGHAKFESTHLRQDGSEFPVLLDITTVKDDDGTALYRIVNATDLTERKRTEQTLVESEERFRTMADSAPDFIWVSGPKLNRYYLNRPWLDFTGRGMEQEAGDGWQDGIHEEDVQRVREAFSASLENCSAFQIQYRLKRHDGVYRWILDKGQPRHTSGGDFLGFIGSCLDITEQKTLLHSEKAARHAAEDASRAKDEFLATISHELRTPLNAILGWATLLREGILGEEDAVKALETIERNARAQTQIVEDILDIARVITGKLSLEMETLDLAQLVQSSIQAVQLNADAKSIQLIASLPETAPLRGDSDRLGQAVLNLLTNAIKFTPSGGKVELTLSRSAQNWNLTVADSGIGIAPHFLPHVFDRFRQADASSTRAHGGLGLGLALVRYIAEGHGGTVAAHSEGSGKGAQFTMTLPALEDSKVELNSDSRHTSNTSGLLLSKAILVIEDAQDTLDFVELILRREGAEVATANSVARAREQLIRREFDAVVCDLGLPDEDGYSLAEWIRAHHNSKIQRLPLLALTAFAGEDVQNRTREAGFQEYLAKPFEVPQLLEVLVGLVANTAHS